MTSDADIAAWIEQYLDDTLDPATATALVAQLRPGTPQARRIQHGIAYSGLIAQAMDSISADDMVRSLAERLDADSHGSAFVRAVCQALPNQGRRRAAPRRRLAILMSAALLLIAVVLGLANLMQEGPAAGPRATAAVEPGVAYLEVQGTPRRLLRRAEMVRIQAGNHAELALIGESTTLALDGATLQVVHGAPGPSFELTSGVITATVAHQDPTHRLSISTAHAIITVVGTRFSVRETASTTQVQVLSGIVHLVDRHGGRTTVVAGASVQTSLVAPPVTQHTVLPSADTWNPLFPQGGLDAWIQQHGHWSTEDGVVTGADTRGGMSRIITTRSLGDFSLECQLRILGINWAEIQVLDYTSFVPVAPDQPGAWQDMRVSVRSGVVSATCNGQPVAIREGMDEPGARFGALAFYVRAGGRLEIRHARFCEDPDQPFSAPSPQSIGTP